MRADGKREGLRQAMAWLHTWSGLILGWLMFIIFFTGSLSYVREEITAWMHPETHRVTESRGDAVAGAVAVGLAHLQEHAQGATRWWIDLPGPRDGSLGVAWRSQEPRGPVSRATLDPGSGQGLSVRATEGGDFFYHLHGHLYGMPRLWARALIGFAAAVMFVALICGIILHKKIFIDFFTFRPGKGARSWMDGHAVSAVLALPFYLVMAFSGMLLTGPSIMPWANPSLPGPVVGTDIRGRVAAPAAARPGAAAQEAPPPVEAVLPRVLAQARQAWGDDGVARIVVINPGTARAQYDVRRRGGGPVQPDDQRLFDAAGQSLPGTAAQPGAAVVVYESLQAVHRGRYADALLRNLLWLCGLLGTAMVASGQLLWVAKRVPAGKRPTPGQRLVQVVNAGILGGVPLAVAVYFWMNRLAPAGLAERADLEARGFFIAWGLCLAWAAIRPYRHAWRLPLALAALLLAGLPVLNAETGGLGLIDSMSHGQWAVAAFDLYALGVAALLGWVAWRTGRARVGAQPPRRGVDAAPA
ncbi:PepSY-associated TM helix domain-containing protein [Bordetella genomosp. 13]|uniref:PepSY-associated TM helix domain-containing protein n=1 Tax=Bordetella genomosp. 13 TaxID=463040 RepID=UPI0011A81658|nr:PepSY-associated TM helix domain-containing protein [Bordetella genomosp. 13]